MRSIDVACLALAVMVSAPAAAVPCGGVDFVIGCGQTISMTMPSPSNVIEDYPNFEFRQRL